MNKKEMAALRKEFKSDSYRMNIKELYTAYYKKDINDIIHEQLIYFDQLDEEMKDLFLKNFKKVSSGSVDTKLFELDFENVEQSGPHTQQVLYGMINGQDRESMEAGAQAMFAKLKDCYNYETDVVFTMIRAEYSAAANKNSEEYEEGADDYINNFKFVLCSINKVEMPKASLRFDFRHMEFNISALSDAIINHGSPLNGFMFPLLNNGVADVNKVLYYNSKTKDMNKNFIENVLNCSSKMDATEERSAFNTILQEAIGEAVKPEVIQEIYERINEVATVCEEDDDGELPTIGMGEVKGILEYVGVGNANELEIAFDTYVGRGYDFKVQNVVPDFNSKSIKIESETANITVTPKDLSSIRQVRDKNGRKCLLIELTEDVIIDGFKLETIEEI